MNGARRVWSELVEPERLRDPTLLRVLAERSLRLLVAATPQTDGHVVDTFRAACDAGVSVGLWPMLSDAQGRWLNAQSVHAFRFHVDSLLERLDSADALPVEVVFDIEPPIGFLRAALRGRAALRAAMRPRAMDEAVDVLRCMVDGLHHRGIGSFATVAPFVLYDRPTALGVPGPWQRLLGTPVAGVGFDAVNVMAYTSLVEAYVPGLRRRDACGWLDATCRRARSVWGARASVSLGLSGGGALGSERPYRDVAELRQDVAIARAAGVEDIALHGLAGARGRGQVERWLDVLVDTPPATAPPSRTWRASVLDAASALGGPTLQRLASLRGPSG